MSLAACLTQDALIIDYSVLMPMTVLMLVSGRCTVTNTAVPPLFPQKPFAQNCNAQDLHTVSHAKQAGHMHAVAGRGQCT